MRRDSAPLASVGATVHAGEARFVANNTIKRDARGRVAKRKRVDASNELRGTCVRHVCAGVHAHVVC